jgi:DNA-directed RNA polymerase subunit E'/Rpb7
MSEFKAIKSKLQIRLAPCYLSKLEAGINEYLNCLVTKYIPELKGVVLSYSKIQILGKNSIQKTESPFLHFYINVVFTVFRPEKKSILVGVVNKVSPDHIGCLVYGLFNASIAADQFQSGTDTSGYTWDDNEHNWSAESDLGQLVITPGSIIKFSVIKYFRLT